MKGTAATARSRSTSLTIRRILFGVLYTVVLYFISLAVVGGILGGVAGARASRIGGDAAEAGRLVGTQFAQEWGWLVLIISLIVVGLLVIKGWLPGTKKTKPA